MKQVEIIQKIDRLNCRVVRLSDLAKLTNVRNGNTLYKIIERLVKNGILTRIAHGLYIRSNITPESFEIANVLYTPSYVSLESALYRYGIITQAPYTITSVTPRKTKKKMVFGHEYEYVHLDPKFYFGYIRDMNILIAVKEKALLDLLYLVSKKARGFDLTNLDWTKVRRGVFKRYTRLYTFKPLIHLVGRIRP
jgi:predicted transcriptional regulator of viral defense system